ncbi:uncharacterized protein [Macrobrachium rosenbergii]|uniref:uncharacterized protein isoform X1 n=1 Tax=Macrobrachium rosenbergii TaxID=79674 RepID=UPI0034D77058
MEVWHPSARGGGRGGGGGGIMWGGEWAVPHTRISWGISLQLVLPLLLLLLIVPFPSAAAAATQSQGESPPTTVDDEVEALLQQERLDEKVIDSIVQMEFGKVLGGGGGGGGRDRDGDVDVDGDLKVLETDAGGHSGERRGTEVDREGSEYESLGDNQKESKRTGERRREKGGSRKAGSKSERRKGAKEREKVGHKKKGGEEEAGEGRTDLLSAKEDESKKADSAEGTTRREGLGEEEEEEEEGEAAVRPSINHRDRGGFRVDNETMITYTEDVQEDSPLYLDLVDFLPPTTTEAPETYNPQGCSSPLGLSTGEVLDWQISASSSYPSSWDPGCHIKYARLHQPNGRAWCAGSKQAGEWVLVDLGVPAKVTGLLTQGKGDEEEWVTSFELSYSLDAYHWHYARDIYNNKKVFQANINSHEIRHNYVEPPLVGRFVRVHVIDWHAHPSLRLELLGCQECKAIISEGSHVQLSASSSVPWTRRKSCQPTDSSLHSHRAWCARRKDEHQWLQWDLGPPHLVTGIITRGRGDTGRKHWVKAYTLTYSNDSKVWFTYKDGNHLDTKVFGGNLDKHTERRHYLNTPFKARFVRLHPKRWRRAIAVRAALLGCPHKGDCGDGFFRVTPDTNCIENLAYKGKTWVNDKRHQWSGWDYGPASLAVDGQKDTSLRSCAIVDNYLVDEPVWSVALGKKRRVRGVVILTWQGRGQDQQTLYRDYVFGLDRLTVYVENQARLDAPNSQDHKKCASVTRLNNALFRERVHIECPQPIEGRYVYIKAGGVANRWHRVFSLVLCEVEIY